MRRAGQLRRAASFTEALRSTKSPPEEIRRLFLPLYGRAVALLQDPDGDQQQRYEALQLIMLPYKGE